MFAANDGLGVESKIEAEQDHTNAGEKQVCGITTQGNEHSCNNEDYKKDKEEWDAVVKLDKQLRTGLYNCQPEKYNYYLHRSGQPLDEVDFSNEKNSKQLDMEFGFENACEGMCGV